jgi:hypothetical protein
MLVITEITTDMLVITEITTNMHACDYWVIPDMLVITELLQIWILVGAKHDVQWLLRLLSYHYCLMVKLLKPQNDIRWKITEDSKHDVQ